MNPRRRYEPMSQSISPFVHLAQCRNSRWGVRRWRCGTDPTAYGKRRAHAGMTIRAGRWLLSLAWLDPSRATPDPQETP
jgi:hypothetical protein